MRLAGDDDGLNWYNAPRAPTPIYSGPVNTASWGSAGDPRPIHEQAIYARGYYRIEGDTINWYSDFTRYDSESGTDQTIRNQLHCGADDQQLDCDFIVGANIYDVYINGVEHKRIGNLVFGCDANQVMRDYAVWNPIYGWIVDSISYRSILDTYGCQQAVSFGALGSFISHNLGTIVKAGMLVAAGYVALGASGVIASAEAATVAVDAAAVAVETAEFTATVEAVAEAGTIAAEAVEAAEISLEVAESIGTVTEIAEAQATLSTALELETAAEVLTETVVEDFAVDAVAEQVAVESLPGTIPAPAPAPAPSTFPSLPGNWQTYAQQAAKAGFSLLQKQAVAPPGGARSFAPGSAQAGEPGFLDNLPIETMLLTLLLAGGVGLVIYNRSK